MREEEGKLATGKLATAVKLKPKMELGYHPILQEDGNFGMLV